jgi:hypothetical protein
MEIKDVRILRFSEEPDSKNEIVQNRNAVKMPFPGLPLIFYPDLSKPMGNCRNFKFKEDGLYCDLHIIEYYGSKGKFLYPILGYEPIEWTFEGKKRIINRMKIWCVYLGISENCDSKIEPVRIGGGPPRPRPKPRGVDE